LGDSFTSDDCVYVLSGSITSQQEEDLRRRLSYYSPALATAEMKVVSRWYWRMAFSHRPVLLLGSCGAFARNFAKVRSEVFDVDPDRNAADGWAWVALANSAERGSPDTSLAKERFVRFVGKLREQKLEKAYAFGTGPSLEKAIERDWSDGYRIVCNTIVRDPALFRHIAPHFIVAGDAIYHFGHTSFARAFRKDLADRMRESDTMFVYPAIFDPLVKRELVEFTERLVPIPGGSHEDVHVDLTQCFSLPAMGNVLALLLLPLASTLSKRVGLWGFDGRAPDDKLFWGNSPKHSYPELLHELQEAHPAFFEHYVPKADPSRYVRQFHGDLLDLRMTEAERQGYRFVMLHRTWTQTLQNRVGSAP
jgi:hypothetical protein